MSTSDHPVAIVTGAGWWADQSPGLGWAIAVELGEAGHHVVVVDKNGDAAERSAGDLRNRDIPAEGVELDITDGASVRETVAALAERHGRLDTLVNAAALTMHKWGLRAFHEITEEECDLEMGVTLRGALNMTRAVLPHLLERGAGNIVFIGSILAFEPAPRQVVYGLSKAALVSVTASLAAETGPHGVRVNCVCPGLMKTRVTDRLPDKYMDKFVAQSALRRVSDPREVGRVVRFLASDAASYVNGAVIRADGGAAGNF